MCYFGHVEFGHFKVVQTLPSIPLNFGHFSATINRVKAKDKALISATKYHCTVN